ncbi:MAG: alpha/beta hydrolase [Candidatus Omnitrophica bacterium]|nr:alpha/beta hydrolase [Candidatus Omnitrophota bacterium]
MVKIMLLLVVIIVIFFVYIRYIERHSIYFPVREIELDPSAMGLSYEDVDFEASDGVKLNGWFIPCEHARDTLLFFHGNAGNISHRLEKITVFNKMGLNLFIIDYRGYGKSEGAPSEEGLYKDAEAAYLYLAEQRNISPDHIILYGSSLGGAVAIDLASRYKVKALITEEAFSSVKDMAKEIYPFLPSFAFQSKFDSVSKIARVKAPKLIIHSVDDEIVPFALGEKLYEAAAPPKEFLKVKGGHNTVFLDSGEQLRSALATFLK